MAELFIKQAKQYQQSRPTYPQELFQFIASKTPRHHLAWDVGTGSGQAANSLAKIFEKVIATDTSQKQLECTTKIPNVRYVCTPSVMSLAELEQNVAAKGSVDLVVVAQAMHWFDLKTFYQQVNWILKPGGVIAAWCYTVPEVNPAVDSVFGRFYSVDSGPYWEPQRKLVNDKFESIEFPFQPVDGCDHTGPFRFNAEKPMDLDGYFTYLRSWSAYQTAKGKGVELLTDKVIGELTAAWNQDDVAEKTATFPIYLRIGKVGC